MEQTSQCDFSVPLLIGGSDSPQSFQYSKTTWIIHRCTKPGGTVELGESQHPALTQEREVLSHHQHHTRTCIPALSRSPTLLL